MTESWTLLVVADSAEVWIAAMLKSDDTSGVLPEQSSAARKAATRAAAIWASASNLHGPGMCHAVFCLTMLYDNSVNTDSVSLLIETRLHSSPDMCLLV